MRATLPRAVALAVLLAAGCGDGGPKMIKVTGKFLKDGQPVTYDKAAYVTLIFKPIVQMKGNNATGSVVATSYPAKVKPDLGTYEVTLPAGKYNVNLYIPPEKGAAAGSAPPPTQ